MNNSRGRSAITAGPGSLRAAPDFIPDKSYDLLPPGQALRGEAPDLVLQPPRTG